MEDDNSEVGRTKTNYKVAILLNFILLKKIISALNTIQF
jgi:hypothetical protein